MLIRLKHDLQRLYKMMLGNLPQNDKDVVANEKSLSHVIDLLGKVRLTKHQSKLVKHYLHLYYSLLEYC